jgi:hypothetical protein
MTPEKIHDVVRWLADCGNQYVTAYLGHVDVKRLAVDPAYGLKLFFFMWAFERAGAPRSYRIAAVKAVSSQRVTQANLPTLFKEFVGGNCNEKANPVFDPGIANLDIPDIVQRVNHGAICDAFQKLNFRGLGPKLRAFILRDIVTLFNAELMLGRDYEAHLCCQPIDVWVRKAAGALFEISNISIARGIATKYGFTTNDLKIAKGVVELSVEAGVSPLRVNQGIWYFSSNAVANVTRLQNLIRNGDCGGLE